MASTLRLPKGKRPNRAAKATAIAINNILARKRTRPPGGARTRPPGGAGVKRIKTARNKNFKVKMLLYKFKTVNVKKGGVVVRTMTVRRKAHLPGKKPYVYRGH